MRNSLKLTNEIIPGQATHPGELIKDELEYRKITVKELASKLQIPLLKLNNIIKGKTNISTEIAIKLENILNIPANYWLRIQIAYEIDIIRIKHKKELLNANISNQRKEEITKLIFPIIKFA